MPKATTKTLVFRVEWGDGVFTLGGRTYRGKDDGDVLRVINRWMDRAHELGGYIIRRTALEVVVVLPEDAPVDGGEAITPWVPKAGGST